MTEYKYQMKLTESARQFQKGDLLYDWELQRIRVFADTWTNYVNIVEEPEWEVIESSTHPTTRENAEIEARGYMELDKKVRHGLDNPLYVQLD